jgi:site-specific DNA-adenine methylase
MLRYAGGKQRAIKQLQPLLPDEPIVSPFLGGGSLELTHKHKVYANDCVEPLISFWKDMKDNRTNLIEQIQSHYPLTKEAYKTLKSNPLTSATFFVVNRSCFSGCMTGGFSGARFTQSSIDKLKDIDLSHFEFSCEDYETFLNKFPTHFAFLDPPYDCPNLYLSPSFDHERLRRILGERSNWVLCYNDTPFIRKLYEGYTIEPVHWSYGMNSTRKSNEIIITK